MKDLKSFLLERHFPADLPCNGEFIRFDRGGTLNGWFIGRTYNVQGKVIEVVRCGDWRSGESYKFETEGDYTPEEKEEIAKRIQEAEIQSLYERDKQYAETAELSEARWRLAKENGVSPYLDKKGLKGAGLFGCRLDGENLLVPCRDIDGKLWGIQKIQPDGGKYFSSGQKIKGCFHAIGILEAQETILIAEGVATAGSLHQATGLPVVSAFNAGNLQRVAKEIRGKFPQARLLLCGDEDLWTKRPNGQAWNPGRDAATLAAQLVGGEVVFPQFQSLDTRPSDYNDLHCLEGLSVVQAQIERALGGPAEEGGSQGESGQAFPGVQGSGSSDYDGLTPVPWSASKRGVPVPPPHQLVVNALLEHYSGLMMKQEEDIFLFVGTHWTLLNTHEHHKLMRQLQFLFSGKATASQLRTMFELFLFNLPAAPVDVFLPRYTAANFLNGTLYLERGENYHWKKVFRCGHRAEDFLLNVIPLQYEPEKGERNEAFLAMLERVFEGDPDKDQKIRAVRQMYGAILCPVRSRLFLLHGPQGSGKSSLIVPAMRLCHKENICSVEPHEFKGFLMESMVGKLVNFVTDIKLTESIDDANLKKIEDRVSVRIDRKFKTPLQAPLPPIHIFGANGIPPTLDGSSGAHTRRWTFIRLDKHKTVEGQYLHDFGNWVFDQSPQGVLNFALEGLDDLIASGGHFLVPESGRLEMREWQKASDPIALFLEAAERGEVDGNSKVFINDAGCIKTANLWAGFKIWVQESEQKFQRIGRNLFFRMLEEKGYARRQTQTGWVVDRLSQEPDAAARY